ncbi:MAG: penicillin acylase family protein [Promethearchaeota archaeon]
MHKLEAKMKKNLIVIAVLLIVSFLVFSIPLGFISPLGKLLFPGNGVWKTPGEVPKEERLNLPNLKGNVIVIRDQWGIPHIYADYEIDMYFAVGYLHAQDRLFQMDMIRRQVRGMLSEVIGEDGLEADKFAKATGMEYWANKTDLKLKEIQGFGIGGFYANLENYVAGINYYIQSHPNELPLEYSILNLDPPTWTTLDSLCLVQEMARQLSWSYSDIYRLINLKALGPALFEELFGLPTPYQIPICPNYGSYPKAPEAPQISYSTTQIHAQTDDSLTSSLRTFVNAMEQIDPEKTLIENEDLTGSNNWVVDGIKTKTRKPILCNDMHLAWIMPGVWYEMHCVANDTALNIYGFAIPGMPLPAVGHNEHVAWGFTNTGYDVMDWYYYDKVDENHYIYNKKVMEYTTRNYTINVKGKNPVVFTVKETVHGPVLSDLRDFGLSDTLGDVVLACRWTAQDYYYNFLAGYGFNHAKNRADFDRASRHWHTLAQNIVYADVAGNIAIRPTGKVPIRSGNGKFPYDGSRGEGEWMGYVPFSELPNTLNPDQHYLCSANQLVAGPQYPKLQNGYASGYRARRINEMLSEASEFSIDVEKMMIYQNDIKSSAAEAFTPYLILALQKKYGSNPSEQITAILKELEGWDYVMDENLVAPTIYRVWREYFYELTFEDEFEKYGLIGGPNLNVLEYLMKEQRFSHWFDDVNTNGTVETRDYIILSALDAAIAWLENFYESSDPSDWVYSEIHKKEFVHLGSISALNKGPYEGGGEGYTVNPAGIRLREDSVQYAHGGASERLIVDLSDLNNSRSVIPSGERGISSSEHYADQLEELFIHGKYHYQFFTNTASNFPRGEIESTIYFTSSGGA